jgi:predicted amidophosphoribosyltransferase
MICPNCEKEIASNIAQCPHCGCHFAVKAPTKPAPKPVPPPPPPVVKEQPKVAPKPQDVLQNEKQDTVAAVAAVIEKNCPHCGNAIAENATFCKWCGSHIGQQETATTRTETPPPSTKFCKNCGKSITATTAFCKWCGA